MTQKALARTNKIHLNNVGTFRFIKGKTGKEQTGGMANG